ncbi:MAG: cupin domain-containing protein, partial [Nocardioidaceae bacterium]
TGSTVIRTSEEGEKRWFFGGGLQTWKVKAEESNGEFLLFEDSLANGKMTPLHCHPHADETFYLLEGEIMLSIEGVEHRVGDGGLAMVPRGVPHAFLVTSRSARMLCLQTPGTAQPFFWAASEPTTQTDNSGPVDFDRVRAAAEETGATQILGPPPFQQP